MSMASILRRLAAVEARLNIAEPVEFDVAGVRRSLDLIAGRRREAPGWKPCGVSLAALISEARDAAARRA
jgi:hypothetical protein